MTKRPQSLLMLQALRAFASLLVMVHAFNYAQYRMTGASNPFLRGGHLGEMGVDLFFVLSGYLMVLTTKDLKGGLIDLRPFLMGRILRIFPTYWVVALVWSALISLWPALELGRDYAGPVQSLLLLPAAAPPPLSHCWSLVFEVMFYAAIGLLLVLPRQMRPLALGLWALIILGRYGLGHDLHLRLGTANATNGLILEFLMGAGLAYLPGLGRGHGVKLLVLGLGLMFGGELYQVLTFPQGGESELYRAGLVGLPAALVVLAMIQLETRFSAHIPALIRAIGDRSYALYLVAPICAALVGVPMHALGLLTQGLWAQAAFVVLCLGLTALFTQLVYHGLEKPSLWLMARIKRADPCLAAPQDQLGQKA